MGGREVEREERSMTTVGLYSELFVE